MSIPVPTRTTALVCWALVIAWVALLASASCTHEGRSETLRASLVTVNAARDGLAAWDRQHQQAIADAAKTREQALAEIDAYHQRRQPVLDGFEVCYRAIALAAVQTDSPSLRAALTAAAEVLDAVKKLKGGL